MMILETFKTDLRYAVRTLGKSRIYTAAAVSSLALAIGASIATFAIVDGLVLRPAPWHQPDEVFLLQRADPKTGRVQSGWSQPRFEDVRRAVAAVIPDVANYATRGVTLAAPAGDSGIRADAEFVSRGYVGLTGVSPIRGRPFDATGADDSNPNIVMISARLDRSLFADAQALGKTLRVNGVSLTVVGVMPSDFFGLSGRSDLWIPLAAAPAVWAQPTALSQYNFGFTIAMRIPRSWSAAQRAGLLDNLDRALGMGRQSVAVGGAAGAAPAAAMPSSQITLASAADALVEPGLESLLWILLGAACCVLVLACANVASLSVARLSTRSTELAVRSAIGATSFRLAASQLVEASMIGVTGASIGLGCAVWAKDVLWAARPTTGGAVARQFAVAIPPSIDARTVAFAVAAGLFTILLIGVWPTLEVRRPLDARRASFGAGRSADAASPRAAHLRGALSIIQLALAFVVTTSAVLFIASLRSLTALDHGFSSTRVMTLRLDMPRTRYDAIRARDLYTELLRTISLTPGVVSADITNSLPLSVTSGSTAAAIDLSLPNGSGGRGTGLEYHTVGPAYFDALGVAMRLRLSTAPSAATDAVPVVVTRAAAKQFWPGRDPVGQSIHEFLMAELAGKWVRGNVVGVAPDVQYGVPGAAAAPGVYVSYANDPPSRAILLIKTSVSPERLVGPARAALRALDPQLVFYDTKTMDTRVGEVSAATRFGSLVLGTYASVALLIALIGVYSVIAFGVSQRRAEIGIRMALGATPRTILSSVLRHGLRVTAGGILIGVAGTFAARRVLASHLFGVTTVDPWSNALVVGAFAVAGVCACIVPALGATRVDPASALRSG